MFKKVASDDARSRPQVARTSGQGDLKWEPPVVYLVANKVDLEQENGDDNNNIKKHRDWAAHYADKMSKSKTLDLRVKEVSATEYRNVRKMWWDMIDDIRHKSTLWQIGDDQGGPE